MVRPGFKVSRFSGMSSNSSRNVYHRSRQFYKRKYKNALLSIKNLKQKNRALALTLNLMKQELSVMKENVNNGLKSQFSAKMECRSANKVNTELKTVLRSAASLTLSAIMNLGLLSEDLLSCQKLFSDTFLSQISSNASISVEDFKEESSSSFTLQQGKKTNKAALPVFPMVNGHTISKPSINLQRVEIPIRSANDTEELSVDSHVDRSNSQMSPIPEEPDNNRDLTKKRPVPRLGKRNNNTSLPEEIVHSTQLLPLVKLRDIRQYIGMSSVVNNFQPMVETDEEEEAADGSRRMECDSLRESSFVNNQPGPSGLQWSSASQSTPKVDESTDTPSLPNVTTFRPKVKSSFTVSSDWDTSSEDLPESTSSSTSKDTCSQLSGADCSVNPTDTETSNWKKQIEIDLSSPEGKPSLFAGVQQSRKKVQHYKKVTQRKKTEPEIKTESNQSTDSSLQEPSQENENEPSQKKRRKTNTQCTSEDCDAEKKPSIQVLKSALSRRKIRASSKKVTIEETLLCVKSEPQTPEAAEISVGGSSGCLLSSARVDEVVSPKVNADEVVMPDSLVNGVSDEVKEEEEQPESPRPRRRARTKVNYKEMQLNSKLRRNEK